MPGGVELDDMDLNENRNGKGAPKWEQLLRSRGATDEEIAEARRDNDRNVTRARQKDKRDIDALSDRLAALERGNGGGAGGTAQQQTGQKMPWDVAMEALEAEGLTGEKAPELHRGLKTAFQRLFVTGLQAGQQLQQQQNAPIQFKNKLEADRAALVKKFGEKTVDEHWPDIESEINARTRRGETVLHAEDVFRDAFPEEYGDAYYRAEDARRRKAREDTKNNTTEGFTQTQRTQPMAIADGREHTETVFDLEAEAGNIVNEALKEAGITLEK